MISQTAEYALRAVVCLSHTPDTPQTARHVAAVTRVPHGYLHKVMRSLARAGLVSAQRGLRGGFVLARPVEHLTVLEVVNAVDPIRRIESCPLRLRAHRGQLCSLHRMVDNAIASIEKAFAECTIAALLEPATSESSPCDFPRVVPLNVRPGAPLARGRRPGT